MPAGYQNLYLEQGANFTTQITLDDNTGAAMNLANFTVASQARKSYYSANADIVFNTTILSPTSGTIQLSATPAMSANLTTNKLVYDVIITDTGGNVTRVLEGQIFVAPSVTR